MRIGTWSNRRLGGGAGAGAVGAMVLLLLLPIVLRERDVGDNPDAEQLVIISPHNEAIRYEFERAFTAYCRRELGREVDIDWRIPGGTSEIVRYIDSEYISAFRSVWRRLGNPWSAGIAAAVLNRKLRESSASPDEWAARQAFLSSDVGIGIDLFFGGGQYEFGRMASRGILVPCGLRKRRPELFSGPTPVLLERVGGEVWYDAADRYYGACLAAFGICFNLDRWRDLGLGDGPDTWPKAWEDLGRTELFGQIGVADPSKSGSITKAFEMLIQQQMARSVAANGGAATPAALARGWEDAFLLVRRIGGNARYFTFSAGRVPVDVGQGAVAAGMCIDFYGRGEAEWTARNVGREVMRYVTPAGGSSVSADPIGMLRGAPHPELARTFIDFVFSKAGQRLWDYRRGVPGGPDRYALRRLPIRRDVYTAEDRRRMSDPDARPFELAAGFTYHPRWTARLFGLIRILIRVAIIDCHDELTRAWRAVCDAGGPANVPAAMVELRKLPFTYAEAGKMARELGDKRKQVALTRRWADFFRARYATAERLAKQGEAPLAALDSRD
ncbi:MAG: ABC transporter substrate-binding protein [Kiritimatiellaeota bacterium]|nr:ABC transporter substrate-binding protein [Kiritimatiellota bacterium]